MENFFDAVYSAVAFIGLLPKTIIKAVAKSLRIALTFIGKQLKKFNKKSFSSKKVFIRRAVICIVIISIVSLTVFIGSKNSLKVKAVTVEIDGQVIGYAVSQDEADLAEAKAITKLSNGITATIENKKTRTEAYNIKSATALSDDIVNTLSEGMTPVTEIYVGGNLLGAVSDAQGAYEAVEDAYKSASKAYPKSSVSFTKSIALKPAYYNKNEEVLTTEKLTELLNKKGTLEIQHSKCEDEIKVTKFETIELLSNDLFLGDSRTKRTGRTGAEYEVSIVTSVGKKQVLSEKLMTVPVREPVAQIVERGIRAQSLVMENYTVTDTLGLFCWPVVDLYEVTSPFGLRSLGNHKGIDISGANAEGALVVAGEAGVVTEAGWNSGGYGNYVKINHGNGIETLYAHMLDNSITVIPGQVVQQGEIVGQVGNTGYSFGAHLHFEVRINGIKVDPAPYLGLEQ